MTYDLWKNDLLIKNFWQDITEKLNLRQLRTRHKILTNYRVNIPIQRILFHKMWFTMKKDAPLAPSFLFAGIFRHYITVHHFLSEQNIMYLFREEF